MEIKQSLFNTILILFSNILILILSIFLTPVFLVLLLVLLPFYVYRYLIYKTSKIFHPTFGSILTARSTLSAVDDLYTDPKCTVFCTMVCVGEMDLDKLRKRMEDVLKKKKSNGDLKYPEMTQYIYSWMGFLFWKQENDFNIKDHIKYFNKKGDSEIFSDDNVTEEEFSKDIAMLVRKPFPREKSPWEILIVRNYKPKSSSQNDSTKHSVFLIRLNHGLGDGFSFLKFLREVNQENFISNLAQSSAFKRKSELEKCLGMVWTFMKIPFEFTKFSLFSQKDINHGWRKNEKEITGKYQFGIGKMYDIQLFKDLKVSNNVSVSSILLAGIAGGIRRMMLQQGHKLPKFINVSYPFPMPNHPDKLRNHMSLGIITLPIEEEDRRKRLNNIDTQFKQISFSSLPLASFMIQKLIGSLPTILVKPLGKCRLTTGLVSNIPGPTENSKWFKAPITEGVFGGGLLRGDLGIIVNTPSVAGQLRITIMADGCILRNEEEMSQLICFIENEFDDFHNINVV